MTPGEAVLRLAETRDDEIELSAPERRFCEEFFSGEHASNATRSFMLVHPNFSYDNASVAASMLLKEPKVRRFLGALHQEAVSSVAGELRPWSELLPMAQSVLVAVLEGRIRNRMKVDVARYICDRCLGTPTTNVDLHVMDTQRIASATRAFHARIAREQQKRIGTGEELMEVVVGDGRD